MDPKVVLCSSVCSSLVSTMAGRRFLMSNSLQCILDAVSHTTSTDDDVVQFANLQNLRRRDSCQQIRMTV